MCKLDNIFPEYIVELAYNVNALYGVGGWLLLEQVVTNRILHIMMWHQHDVQARHYIRKHSVSSLEVKLICWQFFLFWLNFSVSVRMIVWSFVLKGRYMICLLCFYGKGECKSNLRYVYNPFEHCIFHIKLHETCETFSVRKPYRKWVIVHAGQFGSLV